MNAIVLRVIECIRCDIDPVRLFVHIYHYALLLFFFWILFHIHCCLWTESDINTYISYTYIYRVLVCIVRGVVAKICYVWGPPMQDCDQNIVLDTVSFLEIGCDFRIIYNKYGMCMLLTNKRWRILFEIYGLDQFSHWFIIGSY